MKRSLITFGCAVILASLTAQTSQAAVTLEASDFGRFSGDVTRSLNLTAASDSVFVVALFNFSSNDPVSITYDTGVGGSNTAMSKLVSTPATNADLIVSIYALDIGNTTAGSIDFFINQSSTGAAKAAWYQLANTSTSDALTQTFQSTADSGFTIGSLGAGSLVIDLQVDGSTEVGSAVGSPTSTITLGGSDAPNRGFKSSNYNNVSGDVTVGYASNAAAGAVAVGFQVIPEPASLALMGLGGLLMLGRGRRAE